MSGGNYLTEYLFQKSSVLELKKIGLSFVLVHWRTSLRFTCSVGVFPLISPHHVSLSLSSTMLSFTPSFPRFFFLSLFPANNTKNKFSSSAVYRLKIFRTFKNRNVCSYNKKKELNSVPAMQIK